MNKILCAALIAIQVLAEPVVLTDATFPQVVFDGEKQVSDKGWYVKFYAPWCGHCKKLAPTWDEYSNSQTNVYVGKVDCTVEKAVCAKYEIKGYPTLLYFPAEDTTYYKFSGARNIEGFNAFLTSYKPTNSDL